MALCKTTTPAYRGHDGTSQQTAKERLQAVMQAALPDYMSESPGMRDWMLSFLQDVIQGDEPQSPTTLTTPWDPCGWARMLFQTATPRYMSKTALSK